MRSVFFILLFSVSFAFVRNSLSLQKRNCKEERQQNALPSLITAAEKAVVMQKVGEEVYKPIFAAGLGIVGISIVSIIIVALLIDANDEYDALASDFKAQGIAELEREFGKDATRQALQGDLSQRDLVSSKKEEVISSVISDDGYDD
mmetsp:Transcript_12150/g.16444  ORF Transcript_12150/g.16444 Transcript_12150/m.16444 type:complete len:147 (-) Transcript_12150:51-491(-)